MTRTQRTLNSEANIHTLRRWILSPNKMAGEERGLRVTPEDAKRLRLKSPGAAIARDFKRLIQIFRIPSMKVRIYNFPDFIEVWVSHEPRAKAA